MATVGYSFPGINASTKALRIGGMVVAADGMTKDQIVRALTADALRTISVDATLEDSVAIDDGA